ncbi:MAG: hypothetical protein OXP09_22765 [Gammaproteobacteria bacterium]|nr:hypothetical protein [Gammaproteobacteria bacterium]MDE0368376.1 hypothetical protein [Gammaproteobacteria bacterium]
MKILKFITTFQSLLKRIGSISHVLPATRLDSPLTEDVPPPHPPAGTWLGAMRNQGTIVGDLIEPAAEPDDWEATGSRDTS